MCRFSQSRRIKWMWSVIIHLVHLVVAFEQALRGCQAAQRQKENLQFRLCDFIKFHLQTPRGSWLTELSDFRQSAESQTGFRNFKPVRFWVRHQAFLSGFM